MKCYHWLMKIKMKTGNDFCIDKGINNWRYSMNYKCELAMTLFVFLAPKRMTCPDRWHISFLFLWELLTHQQFLFLCVNWQNGLKSISFQFDTIQLFVHLPIFFPLTNSHILIVFILLRPRKKKDSFPGKCVLIMEKCISQQVWKVIISCSLDIDLKTEIRSSKKKKCLSSCEYQREFFFCWPN